MWQEPTWRQEDRPGWRKEKRVGVESVDRTRMGEKVQVVSEQVEGVPSPPNDIGDSPA